MSGLGYLNQFADVFFTVFKGDQNPQPHGFAQHFELLGDKLKRRLRKLPGLFARRQKSSLARFLYADRVIQYRDALEYENTLGAVFQFFLG